MSKNKFIHIERVNEEIARIVFDNPPVNLISPDTVSELHQVITILKNDEQLKVAVFASEVDDFFFNHFDLSKVGSFPQPVSPNAIPIWTDIILMLSRAPFISIASIRGRTRGGGNELALAMDLRYASKEKAFFGQPEVGTGILPGGGGSEWLPRFIGRDRAIEAILGSNDYDADTAERFGWVTRAISDTELDGFVSNIAKRFASFDRQALIAAKSQINRATLPPDNDFISAYKEFSNSMEWPSVLDRLRQMGLIVSRVGVGEMEKNLGYYLGPRSRSND